MNCVPSYPYTVFEKRMQKKMKARKGKKISITLSDRDTAILQRYATDNRLTKAVAIRRIVRQFLADYDSINATAYDDDLQIGLFDTMQTDIFGNLTKTK